MFNYSIFRFVFQALETRVVRTQNVFVLAGHLSVYCSFKFHQRAQIVIFSMEISLYMLDMLIQPFITQGWEASKEYNNPGSYFYIGLSTPLKWVVNWRSTRP